MDSKDYKDEEVAEAQVNGVADSHPEYQEYLALTEEFQGEKLKKLTRKVDWHVIPQLLLIYMLSYIDRANVGNARLFGAEADMGLSPDDWNIGLTVFFVTYAVSGPPSNLALKKFGPSFVLPTLLLIVSFILIGSGCANNRAQWFALRLLLGIFEAGMYPGCAYSLTTWYTPAQIHGRTTIFYIGASAAGAFGGLLAFGIGQLDHTWGYRGWRFIYVIEGIVSLVIAILAYFWIQKTPARQKGWLKPEEQRYLVLRNRFGYGSDKLGSKDDFNWRDARAAAKSVHVIVLSFVYICVTIAVYGLSFTLPTIMNNMGFSAANAQALSAPPYVFAGFCTVASGWYSDKYRQRMGAVVIPAVVAWIGLLICVITVTHSSLVGLTYVGTCFAAGGLYCLSPSITVWAGLNTAGQTKRAVAMSIVVMFSQFGGLVGSNIYLTREKPAYPTGFGVSLGVLGFGTILCPLAYWWWLGRVNARRAAMSEEEISAKYTPEELQIMGDLSPYYKYER